MKDILEEEGQEEPLRHLLVSGCPGLPSWDLDGTQPVRQPDASPQVGQPPPPFGANSSPLVV